ncbi:MAG: hypothetical protein NVS3B20_21180 [Polyangiales bacterium]
MRNVTDADIASFKSMGIEVCIATESGGEVWLVPAYTGQPRKELSVEHAALIAATCSAFPGARVTSVTRSPKGAA